MSFSGMHTQTAIETCMINCVNTRTHQAKKYMTQATHAHTHNTKIKCTIHTKVQSTLYISVSMYHILYQIFKN